MDEYDKIREAIGNYNFDCLMVFGSYLHDSCKKYAINKMSENDWILIKDANFKITHDVKIFKKDKSKISVGYTIKNSSSLKYANFYEEKLIKIMEKLSE